VRQQTWPVLDSAGHSENLVDVGTHRDAVLCVHTCFPAQVRDHTYGS